MWRRGNILAAAEILIGFLTGLVLALLLRDAPRWVVVVSAPIYVWALAEMVRHALEIAGKEAGMGTRKAQSSIRADPFVDLSDRICGECRGLGWMQTGRGTERCVVCDGSGWRQNTDDTIEWLRAKLAEWRAEHVEK